MGAPVLDWLRNPVSAGQVALRASNGDVHRTLSGATLPSSEALPFVHEAGVTPGSWCRFVGMVQDIWDCELYVSSSANGASGFLVEDCGPCTSNDEVRLAERLLVYIVSPPGLSAWASPSSRIDVSTRASDEGINVSAKRAREEEQRVVVNDASADMIMPDASKSATATRPPLPGRSASDKRIRNGVRGGINASASSMGLNHPLANEAGGTAVLCKVYDCHSCSESSGGNGVNSDDVESASNLKVHMLVEVLGIMQQPVEIQSAGNGSDMEDIDMSTFELEARARNPQNVPRLHAVRIRAFGYTALNPLLDTAISMRGGLQGVRSELREVLPALREQFLKFIASGLNDDLLAAEYLLMALVARPSVRSPTGSVLGKLVANVILPEGQSAADLIAMLRAFCSCVVRIDVSIAALNARELYPRKDYEQNRLRAGPMQVTNGTLVVLDETRLESGRLAERGIRNVRALNTLVGRCAVPADFTYYESELPVDCSVICISSGGKSIVENADVNVRVKRKNRDSENGGEMLKNWKECEENLLNKLRVALGALRDDEKFGIDKDTETAIEQCFVEARAKGLAKDGQDTLTKWLAIARACARTFGEENLSVDRWAYSMQLERSREKTLAKASA